MQRQEIARLQQVNDWRLLARVDLEIVQHEKEAYSGGPRHMSLSLNSRDKTFVEIFVGGAKKPVQEGESWIVHYSEGGSPPVAPVDHLQSLRSWAREPSHEGFGNVFTLSAVAGTLMLVIGVACLWYLETPGRPEIAQPSSQAASAQMPAPTSTTSSVPAPLEPTQAPPPM